MVNRTNLLRCLYNNFRDGLRESVYGDKQVFDVQVRDDTCKVQCSDGTIERGSIIIGADGITSTVRQEMRRPERPLLPLATNERPFTASFTLPYCSVPVLPGMSVGTSWEAHGTGKSTSLFVGKERAWLFGYEKRDPSNHPSLSTAYFKKEDEARFVDKWADVHLTTSLRLKSAYEARQSSGMTLANEGTVEHRSWKPIVLVGDSAAKVTPNLGFGFDGGV